MMKHAHRVMIAALLATISGPALAQDAADEYYGATEMEAAREALRAGTGGQIGYMAFADRFEYRTNEGDGLLLWDGQAWIGGDIDKFWLKTEGEYLLEQDAFEEAEIQALYSRAISPYFDLQAGLRHDFEPDPSRNFAVLGVQGLAPYWFEVDAAAFLSDDGDLSARIEAEYEFFVTQRLILQPRAELDVSADDVPEIGIGAGLSTVEAGLRLRYEFEREIAPYLGVSWQRAVGNTADFARAEGDDVGAVSFVVGLRLWL